MTGSFQGVEAPGFLFAISDFYGRSRFSLLICNACNYPDFVDNMRNGIPYRILKVNILYARMQTTKNGRDRKL